MKISIIVGHDKNLLIGNKNKLPWHLPEDLKHFKEFTTGKTILMGRKTFESIGKPLPNRKNIVLTKDVDFKYEGVYVLNSLKDLNKIHNDEDLVVIGGTMIYKEFLGIANELIITEINESFEGDAYFPEYKDLYNEVINERQSNILSKTGLTYNIKKYILK